MMTILANIIMTAIMIVVWALATYALNFIIPEKQALMYGWAIMTVFATIILMTKNSHD